MSRKVTEKILFSDYKAQFGIETVYGQEVRHNFSRHTHHTLCLGTVERGIRIFTCRGIRYEVPPGQIFIIPPDEAHSCMSNAAHTYRMLIICPELLNTVAGAETGRSSAIIFNKLVVDDAFFYQQLNELHSALTVHKMTLVIQSLIISVLGYMLEHCVEITGNQQAITTPNCDTIDSVKKYIDENYNENITLDQLTQIACVSPFHLIRLFAEAMGVPPHIYQQQARIRQAKKMLVAGLPIAQVAVNLGYSDQSHFTRSFKKYVGITPGEFKRTQYFFC